VRSAVDRAIDSIRDGVTAVRNALKGGDWSNVQEKFEGVTKMLDKSKGTLGPSGTPKFYIRMLVDLEEAIAGINKEAQKKMKPAVAHSFNRVKLTVPKYNKAFEADIQDCKAHPEAYEEAEESDAESEKRDEDDSESESGSEDSDEVLYWQLISLRVLCASDDTALHSSFCNEWVSGTCILKRMLDVSVLDDT
jgi:translation initiation factor 3 subunit C